MTLVHKIVDIQPAIRSYRSIP